MIFVLPIGDWSGDGHGHCKDFRVEIDGSLEQAREAHFKGCRDILDIHKVCGRYREHGYAEWPEWCSFRPQDTDWIEPEDMAELWVELLNKADPTLNARLLESDSIPMLPFYGHDEQGRHIRFVGYGVMGD